MLHKKLRVLLSILAIYTIVPSGIYGQNNTMYYLQGVPQNYYLNPATQPQSTFFLGCPVLSSLYFGINNSAFGLDDVLWSDASVGKTLHPLYSDATFDDFLKNFRDANYLSGNVDFNVASLGFKAKETYITLDMTAHLNQKVIYPKDLFSLGNGIVNGKDYDFSSLNLDFTEYVELALGISKNFSEQLTIGIRPKLLFGLATLRSSNSGVTFNSSPLEANLVSALEMNVCLPGMSIPTDADGLIDMDGEFDFDSTLSSPSDYIKLGTGNKGFGIDLGLHFRPVEKLELSFSVLNLGFINWKNYTHTVTLNGSYKYEGFDPFTEDTAGYINYLLDTLKGSFSLAGSSSGFKTTLNPIVFIGGRFFVTKNFDIGILGRFDFIESDIKTDVILLTDLRLSSVWSVSANYNLMDGSPSAFGLGTSFRLGPLSYYVIIDDFPTSYNMLTTTDGSSIPAPSDIRGLSLRLGLNLVFGTNQYKKIRRDKPMYISEDY